MQEEGPYIAGEQETVNEEKTHSAGGNMQLMRIKHSKWGSNTQ